MNLVEINKRVKRLNTASQPGTGSNLANRRVAIQALKVNFADLKSYSALKNGRIRGKIRSDIMIKKLRLSRMRH